jgi:hypothetical protein
MRRIAHDEPSEPSLPRLLTSLDYIAAVHALMIAEWLPPHRPWPIADPGLRSSAFGPWESTLSRDSRFSPDCRGLTACHGCSKIVLRG